MSGIAVVRRRGALRGRRAAPYAGEEAVIAITTLEVLRGALPDRALRMVREWASMHRDELAANWERIQRPDQPVPIAPLP